MPPRGARRRGACRLCFLSACIRVHFRLKPLVVGLQLGSRRQESAAARRSRTPSALLQFAFIRVYLRLLLPWAAAPSSRLTGWAALHHLLGFSSPCPRAQWARILLQARPEGAPGWQRQRRTSAILWYAVRANKMADVSIKITEGTLPVGGVGDRPVDGAGVRACVAAMGEGSHRWRWISAVSRIWRSISVLMQPSTLAGRGGSENRRHLRPRLARAQAVEPR